MSSGKRILIVDDEPYVLRSLGFVLEKAGFEVLQARNGAEALEMVAERRPDLVFLDIMMPKMDGYEVCERIKGGQGPSALPVIMLTAKSQQVDKEKAGRAGADDYMTKPFSPTGAVDKAKKMLGEKR